MYEFSASLSSGVVIEGVVQEKEEAKKTYDTAVSKVNLTHGNSQYREVPPTRISECPSTTTFYFVVEIH